MENVISIIACRSKIECTLRVEVIYKGFWLDEAQDHMNGAPSEN